MPKVIVCGLGQVGFRVALLLRRMGREVNVITIPGREEFQHIVEASGARVLIGDARSDARLQEAGIATSGALIACADNDLANIEIALDALRLNPSIRVVVRLFDQNLAKRIEQNIGIHKALAMSLLSAPAFASAAVGEEVHGSFEYGGRTMIVGETDGSPELAEMARLGILGVLKRTNGAADLYFPDPGACADPFGRFEVVCPKDEFLKLNGIESPKPLAPSQSAKKSMKSLSPGQYLRFIKAIWANTPKQLKGVAYMILALAFVSVIIFQVGMKLSPVDAFYFVTTTLTTTGYGDLTPKDSAPWLKLYGCFLMLVGSAAVATLYSIVTDFIVSTRFDQVLGRQQVASDDHCIVVGLGNVGYRTTLELKNMGLEVVVVDNDPNVEYRGLLDKTIPFIVGDARDIETLERAGIYKATAVISTTNNDAVNLSIGLTVKEANSRARTVVRLFDPDFANKVQSSLNVDNAMSATKIAAPSFVGAGVFPDAVLCCVIGQHLCAFRSNPNGTPTRDAEHSAVMLQGHGDGVKVEFIPILPDTLPQA